MAVLSLDTLTGCSSIPSFLGGTSDTPANPSITLFHNSTAPTNWTKNTSASINDIALRVRGGAEGVGISTGGTLPFTTVLSQKTTPITTSSSPVGFSVDLSPVGPSPLAGQFTNTANASPSDPAVLSDAQIPFHAHTISKHPGQAAPATTAPGAASAASAAQSPQITGQNPGPGTHVHPSYSTSSSHDHPLLDPGHTHTFSTSGDHTHTFTLSQDFNVSYVDIIIATKD